MGRDRCSFVVVVCVTYLKQSSSDLIDELRGCWFEGWGAGGLWTGRELTGSLPRFQQVSVNTVRFRELMGTTYSDWGIYTVPVPHVERGGP
ncbi:hypothetical protein F4808DRAFT_20287 [Astrocystis sublimbata]|nr:hypothetical protein F4808DRAFT_20287 [Astrocystis sublimbata]